MRASSTMRIASLQLFNFRNIEHASLEPAAGLNWLFGQNGAGKTSVLESIVLLSRGRSFRTRVATHLIRDECSALQVVARTMDPDHQLGMERQRQGWRGRIDGQDRNRVSEFARLLPLVLIEPENHQLVEGAPAVRRSFLDWGLFHVEPSYLDAWRDYSRALRQRNAALRDRGPDPMLEAIEQVMASAAARVDEMRGRFIASLARELDDLAPVLGFELETLTVEYSGGSDAEGHVNAWGRARSRDRDFGQTRNGPHRADLVVTGGGRRVAPRLSRGQMKLAALQLRLALLECMQKADLEPLILLDDPVSELDRNHLDRLLDWLHGCGNQVWVTAVEPEDSPSGRRFHVEQGKISPVV